MSDLQRDLEAAIQWLRDNDRYEPGPPLFVPTGDGSYRVTCCECGRKVPSNFAHMVKANNLVGRANRCHDCGVIAHANILEFNLRRARKSV